VNTHLRTLPRTRYILCYVRADDSVSDFARAAATVDPPLPCDVERRIVADNDAYVRESAVALASAARMAFRGGGGGGGGGGSSSGKRRLDDMDPPGGGGGFGTGGNVPHFIQ
jgi:hypothetical protein